jgi:hypothetical protein
MTDNPPDPPDAICQGSDGPTGHGSARDCPGRG